MGAYVTLEQAKDHLRVDFDDDDLYIEDLIDVAETSVANEIGSTLASNESGGALPKPLYQGILFLIGHLYATREPVMVGVSVVKCPYTMEYLLAPYKTWTVE
jgi:hypothetical protein